jgi:hypothetical protein
MNERAFLARFEGQREAFATFQPSRVPAYEMHRQPLTIGQARQHLESDVNLLVLPIVSGGDQRGYVRWSCTDIDIPGDDVAALETAIDIQTALRVLGARGWVERSKSKGYHVWVFFADWCWAGDARALFELAHHLTEHQATEVFPKQLFIGEAHEQNGVNLPYPAGAADRRTILDDSFTDFLTLEEFLQRSERDETAVSVPAAAGQRWRRHLKGIDIERKAVREVGNIRNADGYGIKALAAEVARVDQAVAGTRNAVLNRAAFAVGQLVADGVIDEEAAREQLLSAAQRIGLGAHEAELTVRSGLRGGDRKPR